MDQKKIIIINLSKGKVGEVNATLLGSMIVTKIYLAAMSRADVSASVLATLPSFYFYVDEFQSFANESFADILSEARKYKLNLIIAHQYVEQMEEEVRDAVFGNVGTTIVFRVGPFDAEVLETIFMPQFTQTDLVNLGFAQIYLTLMIDGVGSPPFSATTIAPFDPPPQNFTDRVIENSRKQYGAPRVEIEEALKKWHELDAPPPPAPKVKREYAAPARSAPQKSSDLPSGAQSGPAGQTFAPHSSPTPRHRPPEIRHAEAKVVAENIAHKHATATSKAGPDTRPRQERAPRPEPPKPPLEGATNLRQALASIKVSQHAPDLKDTIMNVAPRSLDPEPPKRERAPQPASLPEDELRSMLAVETPEDENNPS